jgi:plasmid stabilization system protein ParE
MACFRSADADRDLDDIWFHVATESGNPALADNLIKELTRSFLTLARFPEIGRMRYHRFGERRRILASHGYLIIYTLHDADVWVLRVIHGRRDVAALLDD